AAVLRHRGDRGGGAHRVHHPPPGARAADRGGGGQRRGEQAGGRPIARGAAGRVHLLRPVHGYRRIDDQLERLQRRRQQRRAVDRTGRDPRRRDRRHVAGRRAVLDQRHGHGRADHPDVDHHRLLDRRAAGDDAAVQSARGDARVPAAVTGVPRQGVRPPRERAGRARRVGGEGEGARMTTGNGRNAAVLRRPGRFAVPSGYIPVLVTACLFAAMFAAGGVRYEGFATGQIILNVFIDNAFLLVVAVGMTFVILTGGIDLSVGAVVALSTMVSASLLSGPG